MKEYTYDDYLEDMFGNSELKKHKTADRIKWALTLIAFVLVAVTLVGIILGWFAPKTDTPLEEQPTEQTPPPEQKTDKEQAVVLSYSCLLRGSL